MGWPQNLFTHKKTPQLLGGLVLISLVAVTVAFLMHRPFFDQDGTRITDQAPFSLINLERNKINKLEQTFIATQDGLSQISIMLLNTVRPNQISLTLTERNSNQLVMSKTAIIPDEPSQQWMAFQFSALTDSQNKTYALTLEPRQTEGLKIPIVPADKYPAGIFTIDGEALLTSNLAFNFRYRDGAVSAILDKRIGAYKPWLFQRSLSYILLFVLLIATITGLIYFLTKTASEE